MNGGILTTLSSINYLLPGPSDTVDIEKVNGSKVKIIQWRP